MTIIRLILQAKNLEAGMDVDSSDLFQKIPFIETVSPDGTTGADTFNNLDSPRFMKTHLPYGLWKDQLEKNANLKIIQTIRNPKDSLVSFYHHMRSDTQLGAFNGTWDQYFDLFKQKRLPWGDFFKHNAEWYKFNEARKESLVLVYEEMKKDHKGHVLKIGKFLGYDLPEKVLDIIVQKTTVKEMAKNINGVVEGFASWKTERSSFIRKGQVGDWVNYFSNEQSEYVEAKCEKYLEPVGLNLVCMK